MDVIAGAVAESPGFVSAKTPRPVRSLNPMKQPRLLKCFEGAVNRDPVQRWSSLLPVENFLMRKGPARAVQQL